MGPIFSKFNTVKTTPRKGSMAMVDFALLEAVTNNFSDSNVLGQGGFGCVYKAQFEEGVLAAVKKLDGGGYECVREFEVIIYSSLEFICFFFLVSSVMA